MARFVVLAALLASLLVLVLSEKSFTIDWDHNQFLKDGQPFRYVSGGMHYFRVPADLWRDRLRKMRFAGLNAVQTYVEWSSHEQKPGVYDFEGQNDVVRFVREAQEENLLVILRVGPYICAERDMGGLPSWLLKNQPEIKLRSSDTNYLKPVDRWLAKFLPMMKPLLYENGGPIIMVQIENEYGSWAACDFNYTAHLRDTFHQYLGKQVVLFTTDGNGDSYLLCGQVPNVLATIDYGAGANVSGSITMLRRHQSHGPLINSEFYTGWLDYWENKHQTVATKSITTTLDQMLQNNFSVNFYMFHGGTNFGFSAGSNTNSPPNFNPCPTSYDYDAPISEAGDLTPKFYAIQSIVQKYLPTVNTTPIENSAKMELKPVSMKLVANIFDVLPEPLSSKYPISFEDADFDFGFMLYSTNLTFQAPDPAVLTVPKLRDRAQVFVDKRYEGTLSRSQQAYNLSIFAQPHSQLDILVENMGRVSYNKDIAQQKGIVSNVTLHEHILSPWKQYRIFEDWKPVLERVTAPNFRRTQSSQPSDRIPSFYAGNFTLPNTAGYPLDSFLRLDGWSKGVAFLNGHNLGRYWPVAGPQITLYAPSVYFKPYPDENQLVLFELEISPCPGPKCQAHFVKQHVINGSVPELNKKPKHASATLL